MEVEWELPEQARAEYTLYNPEAEEPPEAGFDRKGGYFFYPFGEVSLRKQ